MGVVGKEWTPADEPNRLVKREEGTAPHSHTHADRVNSPPIESSDNTHTIVLTYVQYTSDQFKKFPEHTLIITEQHIVFLVYS